MRKLVLILIAFIAMVTFIRAYDNSAGTYSDNFQARAASGIPGSIIEPESIR